MPLARVRTKTPQVVLLVEDHDDTRMLAERLLCKHGYLVHAESTAEAAFTVASAVRCDVAVLDIHLPDGSGVDLLRRLRTILPIPAVACTARVMRLEIQSYRSAGFDEVVMKPYQPDDLLEALRRLLPSPPTLLAVEAVSRSMVE